MYLRFIATVAAVATAVGIAPDGEICKMISRDAKIKCVCSRKNRGLLCCSEATVVLVC